MTRRDDEKTNIPLGSQLGGGCEDSGLLFLSSDGDFLLSALLCSFLLMPALSFA